MASPNRPNRPETSRGLPSTWSLMDTMPTTSYEAVAINCFIEHISLFPTSFPPLKSLAAAGYSSSNPPSPALAFDRLLPMSVHVILRFKTSTYLSAPITSWYVSSCSLETCAVGMCVNLLCVEFHHDERTFGWGLPILRFGVGLRMISLSSFLRRVVCCGHR